MKRGFSTLEVFIATAIGLIALSGIVMSTHGLQRMLADGSAHSDAIQYAQELIESVHALARTDYGALAPRSATSCAGALCYTAEISIPAAHETQCSALAEAAVSWTAEPSRPQNVTLAARVVNVPEMLALGGTCDTVPPTGGWNPPRTYNCATLGAGTPRALDVLEKTVYMVSDAPPFLHITDTTDAPPNPLCRRELNVQFVPFTNGFNAGDALNDIRIARATNGRVYAYVAAATSTKQFRVYDVTDIRNPTEIASRTLASATGSFPEGWRVFYYDQRAYILTRETAGKEFHIFDVSTPWNASSIREIGSGYELNRTVQQFVVTKRMHDGALKYYAYMATKKNSAELTVLDVTDPHAITEITHDDHDLPGNYDGMALYLVRNKLYLGRMSNSGSDLYVFDARTPWNGLTKIGERDVGAGVIGISVTGPFAFTATTKTGNEFHVYESNPATLSPLDTSFSVPSLVHNGIRHSEDAVYIAHSESDALRILFSP